MGATRIGGYLGAVAALALGFASGATAANSPGTAAPSAASSSAAAPPAGGALGSISSVTAEQIAATASADIRAALALLPTLVIDDTGGPAGLVTLSLRGSTPQQVLVLVDGRRVSRSPSTAFNLNDLAVPLGRVARIDVIPAPASLLYGPDAVGGVVNIVTRPAGTATAVGIAYGRGAEAEQRLAGGVQYGFKKLGLSLDGQLFNGDGYRENGDYDLKQAAVGLAVAPAPWGLDLRWTALSRETGVSGPVANPSPEARREDDLDGLSADVLYLPGGGWDLRVGAFSRSQSLRLIDPAPPVVDPLVPSAPVDSRQENRSYGGEAQLDFDTKKGELFTVGAEWVSDSVSSDGGEEHTAERWGLYTQDQ